MRKHLTIGDVSSTVGDRDLLFNQFLDDYYHEGLIGKRLLIADEPSSTGDAVFDTKLAATAATLAKREGLVTPEWTRKPMYYLPEPIYGAPFVCRRDPRARAWFEENTEPEFANRNLYLGPDLLRRV